jgi:hypothetical protein
MPTLTPFVSSVAFKGVARRGVDGSDLSLEIAKFA